MEIKTCTAPTAQRVVYSHDRKVGVIKLSAVLLGTNAHHVLVCVHPVFPSVHNNVVHDEVVWQACEHQSA